ncbi:MAG: efflux RND transporter permease subunit, partial [Spirochaetales bacterium]|nr:efflux RND transporter permease subunit [Spirochaetales bacterium]
TIAAFLPLMILPGTIGKFLRVIPLTVSLALAASTFEAVVFLPSHFADWPGGNKIEKAKDRFAGVRRRFTKILSSLYNRRKIMVPLLVVIMLGSFALVPLLQQDLFSAEDFTLFYIDLELSPGTPREKTNRVVAEYEEKILPLLGNGEVESIISSVGLSSGGGGNTAKSNVAQIVVDLTERDEGRTRSIAEIMDDVRSRTAGIPGTEEVLFRKATNGPPTEPPVSFRLFGDNYQSLSRVSEELTGLLAAYPDLLNIEDNLEVESPELQVVLKEERASALGIDALALGTFLRDTYEGRKVTTFFRDNQEIDVLVRYQPGEDLSALALDQLLIPLADGRNVPFSSVADIRQGDALAGIKRVDGRREITITAEAYSNENIRSINKDIRTYFDTQLKPIYPEIELVVGGEFTELGNLLIQILRVFLLGIFLIYIILGTQFRSYLQPLLILITIPFAFVGVVLYLFISGTPFSTTVLYAGVALAGIAVNDSIVLVSFINEQRQKGMKIAEAVLSAADTRLRPILLTSLTTIAGLLPTALGLGGVSVVWGPMAGTIIFGLLFSTLTALFIIPLLYGLLFDRKGARQGSLEVSQ